MASKGEEYDERDELMAAIIDKVCDRVELLVGVGDTELFREVLCVGYDAWEAWSEQTGDGTAWYKPLRKAQQRWDVLVRAYEQG
jgi:hypothetical protein